MSKRTGRAGGARAKKIVFWIFTGVLALAAAAFLVQWAVWAVREKYLFALPLFHQDRLDAFMDFFNVNYFVAGGRNPYTDPASVSSYPPLALLIARFFARFADYGIGSFIARESMGGFLSLLLFLELFLLLGGVSLYVLCRRLGFGGGATALLSAVFLLSAPVLFVLERANYLVFAFAFVLLFFALYGSRRAFWREVGYLALAAAFGIKLYPVAFGIVIFKDKRYFALVRLALYCAAMFFVPFLFFDGKMANLAVFWENLRSFSAYDTPYNNYAPYQVWFSLCNLFGHYEMTASAVRAGKAVSYAVCILCVASAFAAEKRWQQTLAAALFTVYITMPAYMYIGVMLYIPLLFYLAEEDKGRCGTSAAVPFAIIVQPLYFGYIVSAGFEYRYCVTWSVFLQSLAMLALCVYAVCYGAAGFVRAVGAFREKRRQKRGALNER